MDTGVSICSSVTEPSNRLLPVFLTLEPIFSSFPPVSTPLLSKRHCAQTNDTRADLLERYVTATGASLDGDTGFYSLSPALPTSLQSLFFTIAGVSFEFTANAQIWPRSRNSEIGGTANGTYLVVSSLPLGVGFDFVMGYLCLQRFYTEFDATNGRVGFANTPFTTATTNSNG